MKHRSKKLNALILASCMAAMPLLAFSAPDQSDASATAATVHRKRAHKKQENIEAQIQKMRGQFQQQQVEIDELQRQLQRRDRQLQQAQDAARQSQQTAAQSQQTAAQGQAQSASQGSAQSDESYKNLQQAVRDIQEQSQQTMSTVTQDRKELRKAVLHPDEIHYRGIAISPAGSFIEAATVYRSAATGGGIDTPFTGIPLQHSDAAQMSEFYGSARQSRIAIKATGKLPSMTLTGYYEMDWLGTGIASNNNQSNSYVVRQRQLWLRAAMNNGWTLAAGQMWSLATETANGMTNGTEALPQTIDPQYTAGFVWTRQYGFRVYKDFNHKLWMGAAAENAQTLNPAGSNLPTNLLLGSAGIGGGLYNSTANYSFNLAPDLVAKAVYQPGWGQYEVFGIARFFRNRIYPASGTPYNDSTVTGGVGGGFRVPAFHKKVTVGLKGLYGMGVGRYGDSTIAGITLRPDGQIAPLRAFSALATLEANPTNRLTLYSNYGGDYVYRRYFGKEGYGSPLTDMSGCNVEPLPGTTTVNGAVGFSPSTPANCGGNNKDVQELSLGYWFNFYAGTKGKLRQGIQYSRFRRDLWSGAGGIANPGGGAHGIDNAVWSSLRYYLP